MVEAFRAEKQMKGRPNNAWWIDPVRSRRRGRKSPIHSSVVTLNQNKTDPLLYIHYILVIYGTYWESQKAKTATTKYT